MNFRAPVVVSGCAIKLTLFQILHWNPLFFVIAGVFVWKFLVIVSRFTLSSVSVAYEQMPPEVRLIVKTLVERAEEIPTTRAVRDTEHVLKVMEDNKLLFTVYDCQTIRECLMNLLTERSGDFTVSLVRNR